MGSGCCVAGCFVLALLDSPSECRFLGWIRLIERVTGDSSPEQILARFPFGDNLTGMPGFGDQSTSGTLKFHAAPEEESTVNDCVADPDSGRS